MKLIIKGEVVATGEAEFADELLYLFRITPMAQDKHGNDRVFTFSYYTKKPKRLAAKHSQDRKDIARHLRKHHMLIWQRFHDAMDRT